MAYPTVDGPYGLKPVNLLGGRPFAGSTRMYPIAAAEGTAIFHGDVVIMTAAGGITKATTTDSGGLIVGVFQGCTYTNPTTGQKIHAQYCPATPTATDVQAYVVDDPDVVYKVAVTTAGAVTMNGLTRAAVGANAALVLNAGSTATGNSKHSLNAAVSASVTTLPLKVIDIVTETVNSSGSSTEVLVIFNKQSLWATSQVTGVV